MPTLNTTRNYAASQILTQAQLDAAFDSIETLMNITKVDADNIQTSGITAALIASNAVTSVKIASDAVTTVKINDLAVTTAKINTAAVTMAKRAALNSTLTTSSGSFATTSDSYSDVTNLSGVITTTGRPTVIVLISDESGAGSVGIGNTGGSGSISYIGTLKLVRDASDVCEWLIDYEPTITSNVVTLEVPPGCCYHIDFDTGTSAKTYKVQAKQDGAGDAETTVTNCKLLMFEL